MSSLCTVCGEHANEHGAIPHEFVKIPEPTRCLCGRGEYYHPWRFCDKYTPVKPPCNCGGSKNMNPSLPCPRHPPDPQDDPL
jgi:hypothetical protein